MKRDWTRGAHPWASGGRKPPEGASGGSRPPLAYRRAFTVIELTVALAILAVVLLLVAQLGFVSLRERWRSTARQAALELAANVLEAARACPWDRLDPSWADAQKLPAEVEPVLTDAKLVVRVEPEKNAPHLKRVTVTLRWERDDALAEQSVHLESLFGSRETRKGDGP